MHIREEAYIEKAAKLADDEIEFVVSTNAVDSYGERIDVDGINLKDFMKNPVVLWGHDGFSLPIANATKVWKEGQKLMARAKFFIDDEFPRKVHDYLVKGRLKAVSIGGIVDEWSEDGLTIKKMTMKEFSVVSIPANPEALAIARDWTDKEKVSFDNLAKAYAVKQLNVNADIQKQVEVLEKLVASLTEVAKSETNSDKATTRVVLRQAQAVDKQAETIIRTIKLEGDQ
jgi:HK97 family phage prohead protease